MWHILITILLIILFISLGLILIVGLFCLLPLKYELRMKFKNQIFSIKFDYLFFNFVFKIGFTEKMNYKATILRKVIFDSNKEKDEENENVDDKKINTNIAKTDFIKDKSVEYEVNKDETIIKNLNKRSKEYDKEINNQIEDVNDDLVSLEEPANEIYNKIDIDEINTDDNIKKENEEKYYNEDLANTKKSKNIYFELVDKIMLIIKKRVPMEMYDLMVLILDEVKKIFIHIKPKKVKYDAKIGLDDPYHMGLILALHSPLYALYGDNVKLTPYFDRYLLDIEFYMMGRPQILFLLIPILRLYNNKKFRKIVLHKQ